MESTQLQQLINKTDIHNPLLQEDVVRFILNNDEEAIFIYNKFGCENFNDCWIYISDEMKKEYLTTERGDFAVGNVNKKITADYIHGEEYKNLNKKDFIDIIEAEIYQVKKYQIEKYINLPTIEAVKALGNKKQYTLATGATFKRMLLNSKTPTGRKIQSYFIQIEKGFRLLSEYSAYITNKLTEEKHTQELERIREEKDQQIQRQEEELKRNVRFKKNVSVFYENIKPKQKNQYLYIATTRKYAENNLFKIGKAETNLKNRLCSYNTGRSEDDLYYFCKSFMCYDAKQLEDRIGSLLINFREKKTKEMYQMHYKPLEKIVDFLCENYDKEIDKLNELIDSLLTQYSDEEPFIPDPIVLEDTKLISFENNDSKEKIDAVSLTDEEFSLLKNVVERFIEIKTNQKVDISKENKTSLIKQLDWFDIKETLQKDMKSLEWRRKIKQFCVDYKITDRFVILQKK